MAPASTTPSPTSTSPPPTTKSTQPTIPASTSLTLDSTRLPTTTQRALITHLHTYPSEPDTPSISDLSALLSDSLARTGWTDRIKALALELLRNGTCATFPELYAEVLRRAKVPRANDTPTPTANGTGAGGKKSVNGEGKGHSKDSRSISVREGWFGPDGLPDVRVPIQTVETGVEFLRERIKDVVDVVPSAEDSDSD